MVNKIERFNKTGEMDGATKIKNFTSIKMQLLAKCDAKYDAVIRKHLRSGHNLQVAIAINFYLHYYYYHTTFF